MIRITDTPKPKDKFGSIPIRDGKPKNNLPSKQTPYRQPETSFLWGWLRKIMALLLGFVVILGLGSPLLVPYLATTLLAEHLASTLDRPVTIPRAEFSPLSTTLTIYNLIIGPKLSKPHDPVDPLLSAATLSIDFEFKRLLDGEIACNLEAERFFLHLVRRQDGSYNLGRFVDDLHPALAVVPWRFSCSTITVSNSRLVFSDEQSGKTHLAEEIALSVSPHALDPGQAGPFRLQASINGTPITLNDTASFVPGAARFTPPPAEPAPMTHETNNEGQGSPDDPAIQDAETHALVQDLAQAVRKYLSNTVIPSVERRTPSSLSP